MVVIAKSKNVDYDYKTFIDDICVKAKKAVEEGHILAHGILIYSRANAYISKVLNDDNFYQSLDEISGRYLNIYHAESKYRPTKQQNRIKMPLGLMVANSNLNIYEDHEINKGIIENMNEIFNLKLNVKNPVLFFFHTDGENIKDNICVEIEGKDEDTTYHELVHIINEIKLAVSNVIEDNVKNQDDIFYLATTNLPTYKLVKRVQKIMRHPLFLIAKALKP